MNFEEAIRFIHGTYKFGSKLGLENIKRLLEKLDNPQRGLSIIHLAGTNGKGSISACLHSILKAAGYRVGLYISPYLQHFTERMQINGQPIPEADLARLTGLVKRKIDEMVAEGCNHPTEFEVVTAIAFCYFAEEKVDYLVLEVGLGGRLDATNVIDSPLVSVITPLGLDHTQYLGETLEEIAFEKGGILKPHTQAVLYPQEPGAMEVLIRLCEEQQIAYSVVDPEAVTYLSGSLEGQVYSALVKGETYEELRIGLLGSHQIHNSLTALWVVETLKQVYGVAIEKEAVYQGLAAARWPGRLEIMGTRPLILLDGAHNPHGAAALKTAIHTLLSEYRLTLVLGMLGDKDVKAYLDILIPQVDRVIVTEPPNPRAMKAKQLAAQLAVFGKPLAVVPSVAEALSLAVEQAGEGEAVLVAGSLYLIGQARTLLESPEFNLSDEQK